VGVSFSKGIWVPKHLAQERMAGIMARAGGGRPVVSAEDDMFHAVFAADEFNALTAERGGRGMSRLMKDLRQAACGGDVPQDMIDSCDTRNPMQSEKHGDSQIEFFQKVDD
jgi:hypothetical protein